MSENMQPCTLCKTTMEQWMHPPTCFLFSKYLLTQTFVVSLISPATIVIVTYIVQNCAGNMFHLPDQKP